MNVTVYLSAQSPADPAYSRAVRSFGAFLGREGHTLIYGGSKSGLMGLIADSVLEAGGRVIGVEPRFFVEAEFQHEGIHELIVTETMSERKEKLMELGDIFVAFPGSTGTLEEAADAISRTKMGLGKQKMILMNINGFFSPLWELIRSMVREGFIKEKELAGVYLASSLDEAENIIRHENGALS